MTIAGSSPADAMLPTKAVESPWADVTPEPRIAPLHTALSGGDEPQPSSSARASMPELAAMLRRSASVPHPAAQRAGGAGGSAASLRGREQQAESILELWDLKRTMERTAKRDEAARAAAEQDKQRRLQLQAQQHQSKQKQQQKQQQKPVSRQQAPSPAKPSGTAAR
jgi:hypothetical protein